MRFYVYFLLFVLSVANGEDDSTFTSPVLRKQKTNYFTFAGKTYYVGTVFKANFFRAFQFCRQMGMQLVSITNKEENTKIGRYVEEIGMRNGHFWTSAGNFADKHQWVWLSTGNNMVFTNWEPGEPNGINPDRVITENCMEARNFGAGFNWNDLNCFYELNFICESTTDCDGK